MLRDKPKDFPGVLTGDGPKPSRVCFSTPRQETRRRVDPDKR